MKRACAWVCLGWCLSLAPPAEARVGSSLKAQGQDFGAVCIVPVEEGRRIRDARLWNWSGSDRRDLVLVVSDDGSGDDEGAFVELHLHRRMAEGRAFAPEAEVVVRLTPDVVAYGLADVHPDPGTEVVLFNARGVFVWRPTVSDEKERVELLWRGDVLWQTPSRRSVNPWAHGFLDFDGDGLTDLLIPHSRGYHVVRQTRTEEGVHFQDTANLRLPDGEGIWNEAPSLAGVRRGLGLTESRAGDDGEGRSSQRGQGLSFRRPGERVPLLAVRESTPAPFAADWDADGDRDLIAQDDDELLVWLQNPGASFPSYPDVRAPLPVSGRDEDRGFDLSYASFGSDLDRDGRWDNVVLAGDKRSDSARTQVMVFTHAAAQGATLFGDEGRPAQVLVLAGLGGFPRLVDVTGDGLEDLAVFSFRPDLLDGIRSATTRKLEIELYLFQNEGGSFARKPVLVAPLAVPLEGGEFRARFPGDATGDGTSELLVRDASDHLSLHYVRATRSGLRLEERPLWERTIDEDADLLVDDARAGEPAEFLVVEDDQVLHVSFP